jgi:integrase
MQPLTRQSFQKGSLTIEPRTTGPVWIFRWRENGPDGMRIQRKAIVGTKKQYPTKAKAEQAVASLRLDITKEQPERAKAALTISQLVAHYIDHELREDEPTKSFKTREVYKGQLLGYILPRWGSYRLANVRTVAVEDWLGSLNMANATKAKLRNVFHALYSHAERYEWYHHNPITKVRQSAQRQKEPEILTPVELSGLLSALPDPFRSMVFVAAATGLRRGEFIGLKWEDIDFEAGLIHPRRSVVNQNIGKLKTVASAKPVALDPDLSKALIELKARSRFDRPDDWVFASPVSAGQKPYWPDMVLNRRVRPAATKLEIKKRFGWHSFRHTYASLLKSSGADVKVVQESLRHANGRITMDLYTQALSEDKRTAQTKVVQMILPKESPSHQMAGVGCSHRVPQTVQNEKKSSCVASGTPRF